MRHVAINDFSGNRVATSSYSRRNFVLAILGAVAAPATGYTQSMSRVSRVGLLLAETTASQASRLNSLRSGLRDLGYADGKTLVIATRAADGDYGRLPDLAAELVRLKMDVLVAFGLKAMDAARAATTSIPIVVPSTGDPVARGLTASFAAPTANVVGLDNMSGEVYAKRLELLKEILPGIRRMGVLLNPAQTGASVIEISTAAGKLLNVDVQVFEARIANDLRNAFSSMAKSRTEALLIQQDTLFIANAAQIADLALKQRLPSAGIREYAEVGGLIGYGVNDAELYRRAAYFVDRLLKGAKPRELPFERASKFELVINAKTARAIGVMIPRAVQMRANTLIE